MNQHPVQNARQPAVFIAASLYALGCLFVVIPPLDILISVVGGTPNTALARWRFGAVGLASTQLPLVLLGAILLVTAAYLKGHRWVSRSIGVFCGIGAVVMLVAAVLVALDGLEVRRNIVEQFVRSFDITLAKTVIALILSSLTSALLSVASFRLIRAKQVEDTSHRRIVRGRSQDELETSPS